MKNILILLMFALLCACTSLEHTQEESIDGLTCNKFIITDTKGDALDKIDMNCLRAIKIYPYPNTKVPISISSSDSSIFIPHLCKDNSILIEGINPGSAYIKLESCGTMEEYQVNYNREASFDFIYDPSSDILSFILNDEDDSIPAWSTKVHMTLIWSYKVDAGYYDYENTYFSRSVTIQGNCMTGIPMPIENLQKEYLVVKELFDEELARVKQEYPNRNWTYDSKVTLRVSVKFDKTHLNLNHIKLQNSIHHLKLGFDFKQNMIDD